MGRIAAFTIVVLGLSACTTADGQLVLRDGYRNAADPCLKLGNSFTNAPDDASPDFVACPIGTDPGFADRRVFVVGPEQGYDTYYVVPRN